MKNVNQYSEKAVDAANNRARYEKSMLLKQYKLYTYKKHAIPFNFYFHGSQREIMLKVEKTKCLQEALPENLTDRAIMWTQRKAPNKWMDRIMDPNIQHKIHETLRARDVQEAKMWTEDKKLSDA